MSAETAQFRSLRPRWLILAALFTILLAAGALVGLTFRTSRQPAYHPADVVYDHPLHGTYDSGSERVWSAYLPPADLRPFMDVPEDFASLGRVRLGQRVEQVFVIHNMGDAPLAITRLYTTCGYLTADLTASEILPGKTALLTLILDAAQYPDPPYRLVRRGAILESNDPAHPEMAIWVQAFITP